MQAVTSASAAPFIDQPSMPFFRFFGGALCFEPASSFFNGAVLLLLLLLLPLLGRSAQV